MVAVGYIVTEMVTVGYTDTEIVTVGYIDNEIFTLGYNVLPFRTVKLLVTLIGSPTNCSVLLSSVGTLACLQ
jgi:hypothetical protein